MQLPINKDGNMETKVFNTLLKETFVFRPFNGCEGNGITVTSYRYKHKGQGLLRYAGGEWIPDDGEYDLAFTHGVFALGVHLPDYTNIIWTWHDIALTRNWLPERLHRYAGGHHLYTVDNTPNSLDYRWNNSQHPNKIAFESAMHKVSSMHGCGNGRGAYITNERQDGTPWLREERVLIQSTMQPVPIPENPICYLCLDNGKGHLIEALQSYKEQLESDIEYAQETIDKAESDIADSEYIIRKANKKIPEVADELRELEVLEVKQ